MLTQDWEQALIADYRAHRLDRLLELVCRQLQQLNAGWVTPSQVEQFIEEIYQESCVAYSISRQRRDRVVNLIQWWDREWFLEWVRTHMPPSGEAAAQDTGELDTAA